MSHDDVITSTLRACSLTSQVESLNLYRKGLFYYRTALLDRQIAFRSRLNIIGNPLKSTDDAFVNVMDAIVWLCLNCFMIGSYHYKCN